MWLSLLTWNNTNINNETPFQAAIPPGQLANLSRNVVLVNRANDYPSLTGVVEVGSVLVIDVWVSPEQDINTNRELLKQYFFGDNLKHNLVAEDKNDGNRQYYRSGYPIRLVEKNDRVNEWSIVIQTDFPYWTTVSLISSDSWDITASGQTYTLNNIGSRVAKPVFEITATTTKTTGLKYRRWLPLYNNIDVTYNDCLDITNGGLDVQTLINTGKMQADGDDFRIWKDGSFSDRWLFEMDSDSDPALCWNNFSLLPRQESTISASISSSDSDHDIYFDNTRTNRAFLQYISKVNNRVLLIDNEAFIYESNNIDLANMVILNALGAQKDTTAASHSAATTVRHIEHDSWILYGDSDATAPDVNDNNKPLWELSSTNAVRVQNLYYDTTAVNRPGTWKAEVNRTRTGTSYTFTGDENIAPADPADELGLALIGSDNEFNPLREEGQLDWVFSHPAGFKTPFLYSGKIYNTGSWPAIVGLQYLEPGSVWFTADNIPMPSAPLAWETFGPNSASLPSIYEVIRLSIDGAIENLTGEKALVQFDTLTWTLESTNIPTMGLGPETSMNFFDVRLTNNTSGEWLSFKCPCLVNQTVTIDCENKQAYLSDGSPVLLQFSSDRESWFDLASGNNVLQYDDVGTAVVKINPTYRAKVL